MHLFKIALFSLACVLPFSSYAETNGNKEEPIMKFHIQYLVVKNTLMANQDSSDPLFYIAEHNPSLSRHIGEFWHFRAARYCRTDIDIAAKEFSRYSSFGKNKKLDEELLNKMKDKVDLCFSSYYYNQYNKITKMLYKAYIRERSKDNLYYKMLNYIVN